MMKTSTTGTLDEICNFRQKSSRFRRTNVLCTFSNSIQSGIKSLEGPVKTRLGREICPDSEVALTNLSITWMQHDAQCMLAK